MRTAARIGFVVYLGVLVVIGQVFGGPQPGVSVLSRTVNGKEILPGPSILIQPIVDIRGLRAFRCTLKDTGASCTAITGLVSYNTPISSECSIVIEIDLCLTRQDLGIMLRQTVSTTVDRLVYGRTASFTVLADPWVPEAAPGREAWLKDGWKTTYSIRTRVCPYVQRAPGQ